MPNTTSLGEVCVTSGLLTSTIILAVLLFLSYAHLAWRLIRHTAQLWREKNQSSFLLRRTRVEPTLDDTTHTFNLFISHTWSTGQDQAAIIKRGLQLYLRKSAPRIFLDVDDLEDISKLEDYVEQVFIH